MDYFKSYVLLWVGAITGGALATVGVGLEIHLLLGLGCVVLLAALLQTWLFFRCPNCGRYWNTFGIPHYCPHCGDFIW